MKIRKESIRVWGFGRETDVISESKYQLDNSGVSIMFVWPMCDLLDVTMDGWNIEQCMAIFTSILAVPLANVTPDFSHFGSTIPRGVTAAIGTAFC